MDEFAAMTAILAKVGVSGVPSDVATVVRTAVVLVFAGAVVVASGQAGGVGDAVPSCVTVWV